MKTQFIVILSFGWEPWSFVFSELGVASAAVTMVSFIPMVIIDFLRKGAVTSLVIFELVWIAILWGLWLATAIKTASFNGCDDFGSMLCSRYTAVKVLSFPVWAILVGYWILLLVFTVMAYVGGNRKIWTAGVRDARFTSSGADTVVTSYEGLGYVEEKPGSEVSIPPKVAHVEP
ncbi:hypothetical protein DL93DRAFT_786760 [Clavulina sp. PMI_390]|nr:hypothetical protein DL93DRAFT_786760 [Clavulina sp. PMI_390]